MKAYILLIILLFQSLYLVSMEQNVPSLTARALQVCTQHSIFPQNQGETPKEITDKLWQHSTAKKQLECEIMQSKPSQVLFNRKDLMKSPAWATQDGKHLMVTEDEGINVFTIEDPYTIKQCNSISHSRLSQARMTHNEECLITWSRKTGTIMLWNIQNKTAHRLCATIEHPRIEDVQISKDDIFMATAGDDGIALWSIKNISNPQQLSNITHLSVQSIKFNDTMHYLFSRGLYEETINIWNIKKAQQPYETAQIKALRFPHTYGNEYLITNKQMKDEISIYMYTNSEEITTLPHEKVSAIHILAHHILSIGNNSIAIWDIQNIENPELITQLHHQEAHSLLITEDKKTMITTGKNSIKLWNINNPHNPVEIATINQKNLNISVTTSDNQYLIARSYKEGIITVYDIQNPHNPTCYATLHHDKVTSLFISEHNRCIISTSWETKTIKVWNFNLHTLDELPFNQQALCVAAYNHYKNNQSRLNITHNEPLHKAYTELTDDIKNAIEPYVQTESIITTSISFIQNLLEKIM